jgi:hypothetical protein
MENKHTPGPWHDRVNEFGQQCIYNPDTWVATCKTPANARLIAAAPEMLEAIRAILFQVIQGKVLERDACITQARAAIAKAEGK